MASISVVLRKKQNNDGTYPLALRITKNRKSTYIMLGKSIKSSEWDAKGKKVKTCHINSTRLNNFLSKQKAEAQAKLLELELQKSEWSLQQIRDAITQQEKRPDTFFGEVERYLESLLAAGNWNRHSADNCSFVNFRRFLKGKDIAFHEITPRLLEDFKTYLKVTAEVSERTAMNYLILIRTIYKRAIRDGIAKKEYYPFGREKFTIKRPESQKIGLEKEEVQALEELALEPGGRLNHARNVWLFSFYFAGMRASDVMLLKWADIKNGRLYYVMRKNDKPLSLKVPEKAQLILDQYAHLKENGNGLVFPDLHRLTDFSDNIQVQRKVKYQIKKINERLKIIAEMIELEKLLSMHIARHSFATISGDKIPIQKLQKLYRHSSIQTTIGYQKAFMYKSADDALDAVLDW